MRLNKQISIYMYLETGSLEMGNKRKPPMV